MKLRKIQSQFEPLTKAEWDESLHPRDEGGKFSESGVSRQINDGPHPASPEEFGSAFATAFKDNPFSAFVSHYSPEELNQMKALVVSAGGKAGVAIKDHGDGRIEATALFNNGGPRGEGIRLLQKAVREHGVNYVECFGPHLAKMYGAVGFEIENKFPFDPTQAPKDWDVSKLGTPDYYTMRLKR